ncbi:MAG: ABC-three component system middle component 7 [Bacilli bacterium]|jgi:hypothetical protein|nr:hypothetical protein [Bacilli bacterium]
MKLPSKIINYDESIIGKFSFILDEISNKEINIYELFDKLKKKFNNVEEYLVTLEVLYLLNKIEILEDSEVIKYVK